MRMLTSWTLGSPNKFGQSANETLNASNNFTWNPKQSQIDVLESFSIANNKHFNWSQVK